MKKLRLIWSYSQGVRLAAMILLVVSCYALYSAVNVVRSLKTAYDNYAFIRDADLHAAYSFVNWNMPRNDEEWEQHDNFWLENGDEKLFRSMKESPAVEALGLRGIYNQPLYSIEYYDPENPDAVPDPAIYFEDGSTTNQYESAVLIHTINPGMFEFFPNLKEMLPFKNPRGIYIVGDEVFKGVRAGDTIRCYTPTIKEMNMEDPNVIDSYPGFIAEFSVEGRYGLPFIMPCMSPGGTSAVEKSIVDRQEKPFLLMLDTEENIEWLSSIGFKQWHHDFSFYIRYKEDATKEEIAEVEAMYTPLGGLVSLEEVQKNLVSHLKDIFLDLLPGAILRTSIMLLCYVSLIVLTVKKKRKEIAVSYICGATKEKNAGMITALLFLVTVPAGLLNLLYIYLAPNMRKLAKQHFDPSFMHFVRDRISVYTVLGYFAVMLLLGWILVKATMGKRSPIVYFKEASK